MSLHPLINRTPIFIKTPDAWKHHYIKERNTLNKPKLLQKDPLVAWWEPGSYWLTPRKNLHVEPKNHLPTIHFEVQNVNFSRVYSFLFPGGYRGIFGCELGCVVFCCDFLGIFSVVNSITVLHHHHLGEYGCYFFLSFQQANPNEPCYLRVLCGSNQHDWTDFSKIGSSPTGSNLLFWGCHRWKKGQMI